MTYKGALLATMAQVGAEVAAFVAAHSDTSEAEIGGGWTLHDAVAHVALWDRVAVRKLAGTPLPDGEEVAAHTPWHLDTFNDTMRARWHDRPLADVLAEFAAAYPPLVAAVTAAAEADCAPHGPVWTIIAEDNAGHYPRHFPVADSLFAAREAPDTARD